MQNMLENKIARLTQINMNHSKLMIKSGSIQTKKDLTNKFIKELLELYDYIETQQDLGTAEIDRARQQCLSWGVSCFRNINTDLAMVDFLVRNSDPNWERLQGMVNAILKQAPENKMLTDIDEPPLDTMNVQAGNIPQNNPQHGLYEHLVQVWNDTINLKLASFKIADHNNFSDWLKTFAHVPHDVIAVIGFTARSVVQALFYACRHPFLIFQKVNDADGSLNNVQFFLKEVGMGFDNYLRRPTELIESLADLSENNFFNRVKSAAIDTLKATYNSNDRWSDFSQYIRTTFNNKWAELKKEFKEKPIRSSTEFLLWAITFVTFAVRNFPKKAPIQSDLNPNVTPPAATQTLDPILKSIGGNLNHSSLGHSNFSFKTFQSIPKPSQISPSVVDLLMKTGNIQPQAVPSSISTISTAARNSNISLNTMNVSVAATSSASSNAIATVVGTTTAAGLGQSDNQEKLDYLSLHKEMLSIYTLPTEEEQRHTIIDEIIKTEKEFNLNANFIDEQQNLVEINQENLMIYDEDEGSEILAINNEISILKANIEYYNVHKLKPQHYLKNSLLTKYNHDVVHKDKDSEKRINNTQILTQDTTTISAFAHK